SSSFAPGCEQREAKEAQGERPWKRRGTRNHGTAATAACSARSVVASHGPAPCGGPTSASGAVSAARAGGSAARASGQIERCIVVVELLFDGFGIVLDQLPFPRR